MATREPRLSGTDLDGDAAARGVLYQRLAGLFDEPDEDLYATLADGRFRTAVADVVERTTLDVAVPGLVTADDHDTLCARFNDLFAVGFATATDRQNGEVESRGPPVPLYENRYREDATWNEVNVDLARAYDHFGVTVDQDQREHHDHLRLELEFAGYLARAQAAVDADAGRARRDFLDRHLLPFARGVRARLEDEPGTDVYGDAGELLVAVVEADLADLREQFDAPDGGGDEG